MKAVIARAPFGLSHIALVEREQPRLPGADEISVRIHANSLNYHDYGVALGHNPNADGRVLMSDGAGIVEAVGEGVEEFAVGDQVVSCFFPQWADGAPEISNFEGTPGDGIDGYAREMVVRPTHFFTASPKGYSFAQAATLPTAGLTAWRALVVNGGLKAGDNVLVLGTGGVSIFALQIAKMMGANVIATSSSDAKLERARAIGADHTINYLATPNWGRAVREMTNGSGVDHVLDVGGPATLAQSIGATRTGGLVSVIGALAGPIGDLPMIEVLLRQIRLQGLLVGSRRHQLDFIQALNSTKLQPIIDVSFSLEMLADAFRSEAARSHVGKIVVEF
jgi:NADPH:quinone reductase-like Zn-dependent oxidoreductase